MLKNIIFIALALVLSYYAAAQLAAQLVRASAIRSRRDENVKRRHLELKVRDKIIIAAVFAIVMILLAWMSNIMLLSTIVCLVLAAGLVLANIYLKGNGIDALVCLFILWIGNLIASLKNAHLTTGNKWGTVYVVLQLICCVLMIAVTLIGNFNRFRLAFKKENEEADKLEKAVKEEDESAEEESDEEESDEEEKSEETGDTEDDESEDEDGYYEEDPFHEEFWGKVIKIGGIILLFVAAAVLAYWLEWKFDFLPPYNM